jgi:DNA-binding Lrp family transcriptional regulator
MALDSLDRRLLEVLQGDFPLDPRPFDRVGAAVGLSEADVLARVARLKRPADGTRGVIRQISAIFDSPRLGYRSTLVAARVPAARLEQAAAVISNHPGVSHNYERDHAFNLWYTLAVPPTSALGLERTVDLLHAHSGALSTRILPTIQLFKIGVKFDMSEPAEGPAGAAPARTVSAAAGPKNVRAAEVAGPLSDRDVEMIRVLQQDLPVTAAPFAAWAAAAGVPEPTLLAAAGDFLARGLMRRFSAVLRHREAGVTANAMGVWAVPPERQEAFGRAAAGFPEVSHCYLRRSYPDWPYTLFTMVHATTREGCERALAAIAAATGETEYRALYSTREFKKVRVKYFSGDVEAWEASAGHAGLAECNHRSGW